MLTRLKSILWAATLTYFILECMRVIPRKLSIKSLISFYMTIFMLSLWVSNLWKMMLTLIIQRLFILLEILKAITFKTNNCLCKEMINKKALFACWHWQRMMISSRPCWSQNHWCRTMNLIARTRNIFFRKCN